MTETKDEVEMSETETWWQRNKKKILIVGGTAAAAIGGYLIYKKWGSITHLPPTSINPSKVSTSLMRVESLPQVSTPIMSNPTPLDLPKLPLNGGQEFPVSGFVRNLPPNQVPSLEHIKIAESLGITLGEHQTYVRPYMKNCA